jgi:putative transposase
VHEESFGVHGVCKVWWQLSREGVQAARWTVERLISRTACRARTTARGGRTTIPDGQRPERAGDLLERNFSASAPNRLWVADFTHVATWGVCYVAFASDFKLRPG